MPETAIGATAIKPLEEDEYAKACLVTQNGKWGAYVITPEMLERKIAPVYFSGHENVTSLRKTIREECLEWKFDKFTDYANFWRIVIARGIEKPEIMPHRR